MTAASAYETDEASGERWTLYLGDSCERLGELADESIDLSVYSPPFQSLYTYSPTPRDIGNSPTREAFFEHYGFVIREMLRVTKTGRLSCVHAADVVRRKAVHGHASLHDFPGDVIRAHVEAGWLYYGRVMVDKNPQAAAVRTKAHNLLFVTKNKDSSKTSPAIGDSLLIFKKPGESATPIKTDVTNEEWIEWAHPLWTGVRETHTLNFREAREEEDEKHLHALQLDFIDRCVRLWSNPGETVLSPFAGIGSEVWQAVYRGRHGIGIELKPSYWRLAVKHLRALDDGQDRVGHDARGRKPPPANAKAAVLEVATASAVVELSFEDLVQAIMGAPDLAAIEVLRRQPGWAAEHDALAQLCAHLLDAA